MLRELRQFVLIAGDIIIAYLALLLTCYFGFWGNFRWEIFQEHFLPFSLLYFCWFILFYIFGLYDLNLIRPKLEFLARTGQCFLACLLLGTSFFYLLPLFEISPKTNLVINILILGILFLIWRRLFYQLFSSLYLQNVAFLGKNPLAQKLVREIENQPQLGYKFVKFLNLKNNIFSQVKRGKIETLILAQNIKSPSKLTQGLYKCLPLRINFMDLARAYEILLLKVKKGFMIN